MNVQVYEESYSPEDCVMTTFQSGSYMPLDSVHGVVAPENVFFKYQLAGPFVRTVAYAIDLIVIGLYLFVSILGTAFIVFSFLVKHMLISSDVAQAFFYMFLFCNLTFALWFWNAALEAYWGGRTIGKAILGLKVLTVSGRPIGRGQAFLRNILRFVDLILGPVGVLIMGMNERMARLGDLAAGTIVVSNGRKIKSELELEKTPVVQNLLAKIPVDFDISVSLRRSLALYVSRRSEVSPARRVEMSTSLVNIISKECGFTYRVEPDAFLCALYLRALGNER